VNAKTTAIPRCRRLGVGTFLRNVLPLPATGAAVSYVAGRCGGFGETALPRRSWAFRALAAFAWIGCIGGLIPAPLSAAVESVQIEDGVPVKIVCETSTDVAPAGGFLVAKISITNGTQGPLAWRAVLGGREPYYGAYRYGGRGDGLRSFGFETESEALEVPAGASREFIVALSAPSAAYRTLRVFGPHVNVPHVGSYREFGGALVDANLPPAFFDAWTEAQRKATAARGSSESLPMEPWSDFHEDWRVYGGLRLLVLRRTTWDTLDAAQRVALCRYVALGGTLAFVPEDEAPLPLPAEFGVAAQIGSTLPGAIYGLGSVDCVAADPATAVANAQELLKRRDTKDDMSWLNPLPDWLALKLPRAALIVLLLVSGALAGPGALYWLAKRQQRHRLFLVLPAIAVGTTLLLLALIFLKDGTGGEGRRAVLTALVDGRPEMAVFQRQAARCGFLLRTDFALPEQALVEQHVPDKMAGDFTVGRKGAACRGDWFRNRSATVQTIVATVPTRAALELRRDTADGSPSVVSTFPAPLKDLFVFADGATWHAPLVQPGAPTPLLRLPEKPAREFFEHRSVSVDGAIKWMFNGTDSNGRFLAATERLEGAPLPTLDSIRWTDTIFVTGRVTEGGAR